MSLPEHIKFSIDRPFGVTLDSYFQHGYELVTGQKASSFVFKEGVTPLSTPTEVIVGCITYFAIIFGGRYLMKNYEPLQLRGLFQLHNFLLTVASGALLVLFVEQLSPILLRKGIFYAVCNQSSWTQKLELLYYLNYLVKWWELVDTVFLVLKKKNLEFLHVYHHSMTMALCYSQLVGRTSVSWVPITLNLIVHVFMYYYYFRTAAGVKIWWKKYLTTMQIIQFVIDLGFIYFCSYTYFASTYMPHLPNAGHCSGTETAAAFGCLLLSSYLLLFIQFYFKTYNNKSTAKSDKPALNSDGVPVNGSGETKKNPKSKKI